MSENMKTLAQVRTKLASWYGGSEACLDKVACAQLGPMIEIIDAQIRSAGQPGRVLTCVYCGHEYAQGTPAAGDKVLTDHIAQCASHPMRAVVEQRDRLRAALVGLVGASARADLEAMESVVRSVPVAEEDRAVTLNALHALRDTAPLEPTA